MTKVKKLSKTRKPLLKAFKKKNNRKIRPEMVGFIIFCSILTVPTLIVLGIMLINQITQVNLERKLANESMSARMQQVPLNDEAHKLKLDLIVWSGVQDESATILSERLDTCMLVGTAQGWVNTDWQQKCFTTYLDYIPTSLPKEEVVAKLQAVSDVEDQFGVVDIREGIGDCRIFKLKYSASLRFFSTKETSDRCTILKHDSKGEAGSITQESREERLVIKSFNTQDFDQTKAYIQVDSRFNYYDSEKLGCHGIMCGPPLEHAVPSFE